MFDAITRPTPSAALHAASGLQTLLGYSGPERRCGASLMTRWLAQTLDEIDYGMLLVSGDGHVLHVNHAARAELDAGHPLQLLGHRLRARQASDVAPLHDALAAARRGLRKLLTLGEDAQRVGIAVVPMGAPAAHDGGEPTDPVTLLVLSKRQVCPQLSLEGWARALGLTQAEARVLGALCRGLQPREIADEHGVRLATVRTQIGCIRDKSSAESIRAIIGQVARLPPLVSALRGTVQSMAAHGSAAGAFARAA